MGEVVDMPMSAYEVMDMGWVTSAGDPEVEKSVSWVNFPCVTRFEVADLDSQDEYSVPVSTQDLVSAGIEVKPGAFLWGAINAAATQRSEVLPNTFNAVKKLTPEQQAKASAAWNYSEI